LISARPDKDSKPPPNEQYGVIFLGGSPDISPTDQRTTAPFAGNHRKALAVLGASDQHPSISRNPPTASTQNSQIAPWDSAVSPGTMPSGYNNNYFDDTSEQLSPSLRPGTSRTTASDSPDLGIYDGDERRPSVASANTISSQGSKSSAGGGRFHKKLQGFFGEEVAQSSHGSDQSLTQGQTHSRSHDRNNSVHTTGTGDRPLDLADSRPRTPLPTSDITPWDYQNFKVSDLLGELCI
jgi:adenylate cyclase